MSVPALFDLDFYLQKNPDVAGAVAQGWITAYDHFMSFGMSEGRLPFSNFNVDYYLAQSPDVAAAVSSGEVTAVEHFFKHGTTELREFSPLFNLQAYLDANPDVKAGVESGLITAAQHLMTHGIVEARDLGNGVNLADFGQDEVFSQAVAAGNLELAFARLGEVIPFLPSFVAPTGWNVVPIDALSNPNFVLPAWMGEGVLQQITQLQNTILNSGLLDPNNLNPDGSGLKDPSALVDLILGELYGTSPVTIIGDLPGGTDFLGGV